MQNGRHYSRVLLFHSTRPDSPGGLGTKGRSESADTNTQHYTLHELDKISRLLVFITLSTTETPLNATVHIRLSTAEGGEKKKISKSDSVSQNYTQTKSKGRLLCSTAFLNRWHCKTTQFEFNSALFFLQFHWAQWANKCGTPSDRFLMNCLLTKTMIMAQSWRLSWQIPAQRRPTPVRLSVVYCRRYPALWAAHINFEPNCKK